MRLINTESLEFLESVNHEHYEYAILAHDWDPHGEEVTYEVFRKKKLLHLKAYTKIKQFCELAARDGYEWAWVNPCCVDRKNSHELNEAINSMYEWYAGAGKCYVYLEDFDLDKEWSGPPLPASESERFRAIEEALEVGFHANFLYCRYFSRDWTLPELLAPSEVVIFDAKWKALGTRRSLARYIHGALGIDQACLERGDLSDANCTERMSWASNQIGTGIEDTAYSLLGIFNVNMPISYGEGYEAFARLYLEICRSTEWSRDLTTLLWDQTNSRNGQLPSEPENFRHREWITDLSQTPQIDVSDARYDPFLNVIRSTHYTLTDKGFQIDAFIIDAHLERRRDKGYNIKASSGSDSPNYVLFLPCYTETYIDLEPAADGTGEPHPYRTSFDVGGLQISPLTEKDANLDDGVPSFHRVGEVITVSSEDLAKLFESGDLKFRTILLVH